ncbi:TonB family protein [Rhodoferax sp. BLA1]|uniref:TonB family protein n=1 Tax=Rhodoferax sp. BLA1 TaxID=2576062 RepID=UPI00272D8092|nr:TonB family protein [Rhodoferax sp. BLA1]
MRSLTQRRSTWLSMSAADRRPFVVVAYVLVFHALALWALQSGLLRQAVEMVVPVQMLSEFIEPPAPRVMPPAPPVVVKRPVTQPKTPVVPQTLAVRTETPAPEAWTVPVVPVAPLAPIAAPVESPTPAPPAPVSVVLPSSDADYLQNPKPVYPSASKRRGEQGLVIHSVLIGTDGLPVSARLVKSSGFDALDQAALTAVMRWRYIPGKRNGVPTTMSFNVPINWVLE